MMPTRGFWICCDVSPLPTVSSEDLCQTLLTGGERMLGTRNSRGESGRVDSRVVTVRTRNVSQSLHT